MSDIQGPENQFDGWKLYTVFAPVGVFLLAWISAAYVFDLPDSFITTFGTGDVLPLAALILLSVSADIDHEAMFGQTRDQYLFKLKGRSTLLAMANLVGYGAIRGKAMTLLVAQPLSADSGHRLLAFSVVSIGCLALSITLGTYTKTKLVNEQISRISPSN